MMTSEERQRGELALRSLCKGGVVGGIRFGSVLQLLIDYWESRPSVQGQVYINLESRWAVFESRPSSFPAAEDELPERSVEEDLRLLCALREQEIVEIELGQDAPHLILTLENGKVFFLNGLDSYYESWQVGVAFGAPNWLVVACPEGNIAVWSP